MELPQALVPGRISACSASSRVPYWRARKPSSITKYPVKGTLKTWANELDLGDAVGLLDATLQEEKKADAILTKIAESVVNQEAE
jgi:hypothetical protein